MSSGTLSNIINPNQAVERFRHIEQHSKLVDRTRDSLKKFKEGSFGSTRGELLDFEHLSDHNDYSVYSVSGFGGIEVSKLASRLPSGVTIAVGDTFHLKIKKPVSRQWSTRQILVLVLLFALVCFLIRIVYKRVGNFTTRHV